MSPPGGPGAVMLWDPSPAKHRRRRRGLLRRRSLGRRSSSSEDVRSPFGVVDFFLARWVPNVEELEQKPDRSSYQAPLAIVGAPLEYSSANEHPPRTSWPQKKRRPRDSHNKLPARDPTKLAS